MEHLEARALLGADLSDSRVVRFSVLTPVYPSLGCGKLRVLRVRPLPAGGDAAGSEVIEVIAGYESYERLEF